jgi:hypothetical protein
MCAASLERLSTEAILDKLHKIDGSPWTDWYGRLLNPATSRSCCARTASRPPMSRWTAERSRDTDATISTMRGRGTCHLRKQDRRDLRHKSDYRDLRDFPCQRLGEGRGSRFRSATRDPRRSD